MRRLARFIKFYGGTIIILFASFCMYEVATDLCGWLDPVLFPGFSRIWPTVTGSSPQLFECFLSSMGLLIPGYFIAALAGFILGVVIALSPRFHKNLKPIIFALSPIPPSMLTPYLIAVLPTFYISSVAVIFIGCFWPFLNGTISGILLIDQKYLDNSKVLELSGIQMLTNVILPAASPMILAGAGTALNFAFILLTVAEMFATNSGLGYYIQYYADFSDYARVLGGLLVTIFVFVSIMIGFDAFKRRVLFWTLNEHH